MKAILLFLIYGLTLNYSTKYCRNWPPDSTCHDTTISDDHVYCQGYYGCRSTEIIATATINCDGFFACDRSQQLKSPTGSIYCSGDYGCHRVDKIITNSNLHCNGEAGCYLAGDLSANNIYCSGEFGCAFIQTDITAKYWVKCDGPYGCYYSDGGTISATNVDATGYMSAYRANIEAKLDVTCGNEFSCYYTTIEAGDQVFIEGTYGAYYADITAANVWVFGRYGVYGADITSKSGSSLRLYLYGSSATYDTHVYVLDTSNSIDAYIYCYSDDACRYLDVYYYGDLSAIYVYPTDCKSYEGTANLDGVYCPRFTSDDEMSEEEFEHRKGQQIEASHDYQHIKRENEKTWQKAEKKRKVDEERLKERLGKAEDDIEAYETNKGSEQRWESNKSIIMMFVGILIGFFITFIGIVCYMKENSKKKKNSKNRTYEQLF